MTRIYSVTCIERVHIKSSIDELDVPRVVTKTVAVDGYAEDAIKKVKALIKSDPISKGGDVEGVEHTRVGIDVVSVQLQNEAE